MAKFVYPTSTKIIKDIVEVFQDTNRAQHGGKIKCLTPYMPQRKSFFGLRNGNMEHFYQLIVDNKKLGKTKVDFYKDANNIWVDTYYEKRFNLKQERKTHSLKKRLQNLKPTSFIKCALVPELCWSQYVVPFCADSVLLFNDEYSTKQYCDTFTNSKKEFAKNSKSNNNNILVNHLPSLSFRLDVFPQFNHSNKDTLSKIKIEPSLQYYFLDDKYEIIPNKSSRSYVGNPHFHFNCESLSMKLSEKNQGIAISLDNLIKYLENLAATPLNSKAPIVHDSLYMPFLDIAKGNLIYKSNMGNLFDTYHLKDNEKMKQLEKRIDNLCNDFLSHNDDSSISSFSSHGNPPGAKPSATPPSVLNPSDKPPTTNQFNSGIVSVLTDCCLLAEVVKNSKDTSLIRDVSSALTMSLMLCKTKVQNKPVAQTDQKIKIKINNKSKANQQLNKHEKEIRYKKPDATTSSKKKNPIQKDNENERER